jgi:hypothetical protein
MLTQKDQKGNEYSIEFMSMELQGVELNYPPMDKKDFVVHKAINNFMPYILNNHTKVIVPHPTVIYLFV